MPAALLEANEILSALTTQATNDVISLMSVVSQYDRADALATLTVAYPDLMQPYLVSADLVGQEFYTRQPGGVPEFAPVAASAPPDKALGANARWMYLNPDPVNASGVITKAVFGMFRESQVVNTAIEHGYDDPDAMVNRGYETTWARRTQGGACGFCQVLQTRDMAYTSAKSALGVVGARNSRDSVRGRQPYGAKYHDHCRCVVIPVRPGATYEPQHQTADWTARYEDAIRASQKRYGRFNLDAVARMLEAAA